VKTVTHEELTSEELGGAETHAAKSGVAHFVAENDIDALNITKQLLSYLPQNNAEEPPFIPNDDPFDRMEDELNYIVPANPNQPYDIREIIDKIAIRILFSKSKKICSEYRNWFIRWVDVHRCYRNRRQYWQEF